MEILITSRFEEFVREKYYNELLTAIRDDEALVIDFNDLDRFDPILADQLLEEPEQVLKQFEEAVSNLEGVKIHVRIRNLPERRMIRIRSLRAKHLGKLLTIDTIVKSASEVKPQIQEAVFQCPECGTKIAMPQEGNVLQKPYQCECGRRGDFNLAEKKMMDVRWLVGVEPFELTTGERPGEISIFLKEDLTTPRMQRKTDPGNRLKIVGVLKELPKRIKGKLSTRMDMYIDSVYVEPSEIEFEELDISEEDEKLIKELASDPNIYEKLKASVAPAIYGFDEIKESLVLQMFGGNRKILPDGTIIRGNIHILLTGDPGVGKTQLLKLVASVMPRGRYVSGSGVTGAGMCTTYDTLVVLGDGTIRKIGELVEERAMNMKEVGSGVYNSNEDGLYVMALDQKDLKIKPMKITKYWKIESPKNLIKITTRTGKEIRATENNPIPVFSIGKFEQHSTGQFVLLLKKELCWIKAKDLNAGDFIACPKTYEENSDIFWDEVKSVEIVEGEDYVYDLTVEKEHSFVANGMIIHNTATVVKNEAIGGWVLEAGALILCNKGLISIDEFDKISRDDQIAMHEATSAETVSIAKASIVATLPAQTAVLAGANPKFGRFDPFRSIVEQLDIPETLLSRFDLKFAIRDVPDKTKDERLAEHIIISRVNPQAIEPIVDKHFLRKYIAYAKQITDVELTPEAAELFKRFYVDMRSRYATEEVPTVSITLRQYEALIRLAEASAKIRLDTKIRVEDAERAIRLMQYSLSQLGYDIETGRIDIDKIESGITAGRRRKIVDVLGIIDRLQREVGREVAIDDVKAAAEEAGLGEIEETLDHLKREGMIYEPRPGFIRKI